MAPLALSSNLHRKRESIYHFYILTYRVALGIRGKRCRSISKNMNKLKRQEKPQFDNNWLNWVIEYKKVVKCKCNLLKSKSIKGCPHLQVMEIPEELKIKRK